MAVKVDKMMVAYAHCARDETNGSAFHALRPCGGSCSANRESPHLKTHLLPVVQLGLGGPGQEADDVLGHLTGGRRGPVLVLDETVVEHSAHGDPTAGEVGVVVHTLGNGDTWWGVDVTGEQRVDVVLCDGETGRDETKLARLATTGTRTTGVTRGDTHGTTVSGLGHQREIGGQSTRIPGPGGLVIGIRRRHVIGQFPGPLEHFTLVVRSVLVLDLFGHPLDLVDGVGDTDEVSPGDPIERMTGRTDLPVDLVSTSDGRVVKRVEDASVGPGILGRVETVVGGSVGARLGQKGELTESVRIVGYRTEREGGRGRDGWAGGECL